MFKEEQPRNACEFKKNVFILTSDPLHMYCVYDWEVVKLIPDSSETNVDKNHTYLFAMYHEVDFPFVCISGKEHVLLLNINTLKFYPIINGEMATKYKGMRLTFSRGDFERLELHMVFRVEDKKGWKDTLQQYSQLTMGRDLMEWLRNCKRLPTTRTDEYFEEIAKMRELEAEYRELMKSMLQVDDHCNIF